ncbi:MAG: hypothetical protein H7A33_08540 [Deltaproteobacteria bacterium]|nr:hypothetical protein [Deltaproteobacteria bacterium]
MSNVNQTTDTSGSSNALYNDYSNSGNSSYENNSYDENSQTQNQSADTAQADSSSSAAETNSLEAFLNEAYAEAEAQQQADAGSEFVDVDEPESDAELMDRMLADAERYGKAENSLLNDLLKKMRNAQSAQQMKNFLQQAEDTNLADVAPMDAANEVAEEAKEQQQEDQAREQRREQNQNLENRLLSPNSMRQVYKAARVRSLLLMQNAEGEEHAQLTKLLNTDIQEGLAQFSRGLKKAAKKFQQFIKQPQKNAQQKLDDLIKPKLSTFNKIAKQAQEGKQQGPLSATDLAEQDAEFNKLTDMEGIEGEEALYKMSKGKGLSTKERKQAKLEQRLARMTEEGASEADIKKLKLAHLKRMHKAEGQQEAKNDLEQAQEFHPGKQKITNAAIIANVIPKMVENKRLTEDAAQALIERMLAGGEMTTGKNKAEIKQPANAVQTLHERYTDSDDEERGNQRWGVMLAVEHLFKNGSARTYEAKVFGQAKKQAREEISAAKKADRKRKAEETIKMARKYGSRLHDQKVQASSDLDSIEGRARYAQHSREYLKDAAKFRRLMKNNPDNLRNGDVAVAAREFQNGEGRA